MVARGDLGVEAGFDKVPLMQKQLVRDGAARGKPVIVATQMLESMISSPVPTRAEVSDVANAVLDGADALMLSGETAVGRYPLEAVERMAAVIEEIEASELYLLRPEPVRVDEYSFDNAIAAAAVRATRDLGLKVLAVFTESGHTASLVSAYRPRAVVLGMSRQQESLRRMALRWGVVPVCIDHWITDVHEGLGVVECSFCRGTGWAERSSIPPEIAPAVLNRQFHHVKALLRRVVGALSGFTVAQIGRLKPDKRRAVVARLMQLEWRIEDLAESSAIGIDEERIRLGVIAQKIHARLEMLKEH